MTISMEELNNSTTFKYLTNWAYGRDSNLLTSKTPFGQSGKMELEQI